MPTGLLRYLAGALGLDKVTVRDLTAYAMAVAGHSAFTEYFAEELLTPGVRLPLTRDPELWSEAVRIGHEFLWAATYGESGTRPDASASDQDGVGFSRGDPPGAVRDADRFRRTRHAEL
ncbi:type ISP restriction/modification enzyme [Streptomyces sp. NPDC005262]|uniref:type ISP restriction/modification enzyme n=1 Tax=Streptomyces sp. NPDC005262 TaxID=3364710 RepID=UPI0036824417